MLRRQPRRPPGQGGPPQFRRHHLNVPSPIRRGVPRGCTSRVFTASMTFTLNSRARLSPSPALRRGPNDAAGFTPRYGRSVAPPKGLSTLGFDPTRFQTEPPACYRASWQLPGPDSHRQATTSFSLSDQPTGLTSNTLGARTIGASDTPVSTSPRDMVPNREVRGSGRAWSRTDVTTRSGWWLLTAARFG